MAVVGTCLRSAHCPATTSVGACFSRGLAGSLVTATKDSSGGFGEFPLSLPSGHSSEVHIPRRWEARMVETGYIPKLGSAVTFEGEGNGSGIWLEAWGRGAGWRWYHGQEQCHATDGHLQPGLGK